VRNGRAVVIAAAGLITWLFLLASPAQAHAVGPGGGVEIEMLLVAGAVLLLGLQLRASKTAETWVPWTLIGVAVALGALSFALPQLNEADRPSNVSLAIVSPNPGETVRAGKPIEVEVGLTGAPIARSATDSGKGHLHIFIDGQLQQMPYSTSTTVTFDPGTHELLVEFVDPEHVPYDPPIQTSIEVKAKE
jgi:hypothetical protein